MYYASTVLSRRWNGLNSLLAIQGLLERPLPRQPQSVRLRVSRIRLHPHPRIQSTTPPRSARLRLLFRDVPQRRTPPSRSHVRRPQRPTSRAYLEDDSAEPELAHHASLLCVQILELVIGHLRRSSLMPRTARILHPGEAKQNSVVVEQPDTFRQS